MVRACPPLAAVLFALVFTVPAPAAPPEALAKKLDDIIERPDYKHASWGVLVVDAKTGDTVYARNPDAMLAPASVTKLFLAPRRSSRSARTTRRKRPSTSAVCFLRARSAATSCWSRPAT